MTGPILLPALQGQFWDWVYYAAIMPLSEVKDRIGFAHLLHRNRNLGELIQRQLQDSGSGKRNRQDAIANYLKENDSRFFNAIVVGIYGGDPVWHPFGITARPDFDMENIGNLAEQERVGFLELTGTERLFALDGQHRVSGIKRALEKDGDAAADILTVLFVPHSNTVVGIQRTRSLFIDLNKRAVPVGLKDIIILDEVDLPAILARRLVDDHKWFSRGQVDIQRFTPTIPPDSDALLSIATLYGIIKRLLSTAFAVSSEERRELREAVNIRLAEERIDYYYCRAIQYFCGLAELNNRLKEYFNAGPESGIASMARDPAVRDVLFRPVGQMAFANAVAAIAKAKDMQVALGTARTFPMDMAVPPFARVIWDTERKRMIASGAPLAGRLLRYMCGVEPASQKLLFSYRLAVGDGSANLPDRFDRS